MGDIEVRALNDISLDIDYGSLQPLWDKIRLRKINFNEYFGLFGSSDGRDLFAGRDRRIANG